MKTFVDKYKNNIFKGAKFRDEFRTRDNKLAVYHRMKSTCNWTSDRHYLICEDGSTLICNSDGLCLEISLGVTKPYNMHDIVSRCNK